MSKSDKLEELADTLTRQLDTPNRTADRDKQTIRRALQEAFNLGQGKKRKK
jgi:hypothetical protein